MPTGATPRIIRSRHHARLPDGDNRGGSQASPVEGVGNDGEANKFDKKGFVDCSQIMTDRILIPPRHRFSDDF